MSETNMSGMVTRSFSGAAGTESVVGRVDREIGTMLREAGAVMVVVVVVDMVAFVCWLCIPWKCLGCKKRWLV